MKDRIAFLLVAPALVWVFLVMRALGVDQVTASSGRGPWPE